MEVQKIIQLSLSRTFKNLSWLVDGKSHPALPLCWGCSWCQTWNSTNNTSHSHNSPQSILPLGYSVPGSPSNIFSTHTEQPPTIQILTTYIAWAQGHICWSSNCIPLGLALRWLQWPLPRPLSGTIIISLFLPSCHYSDPLSHLPVGAQQLCKWP